MRKSQKNEWLSRFRVEAGCLLPVSHVEFSDMIYTGPAEWTKARDGPELLVDVAPGDLICCRRLDFKVCCLVKGVSRRRPRPLDV